MTEQIQTSVGTNSFADTTPHALGEPVTAHRCYAVYKDYDGNAPDTGNLVLCATEELAKQVASVLTQLTIDGEEGEEGTGPDADFNNNYQWPHCDGFEYAASYSTRPALGTPDQIATSLSDARQKLLGS